MDELDKVQPTDDTSSEATKSDPKPSPKADDDFDKERAIGTIVKQRTENSELKGKLTATETELKALRDKVDEFESRDKSELDKEKASATKLSTEVTKLQNTVEKLQGDLKNANVRYEILLFASQSDQHFNDPEDVLRYLEPTDIEYDEDGLPERKSLKAALEKLLKARPYLTAKVEDDAATKANGNKGHVTIPATPKPDDIEKAAEATQETARPAFKKLAKSWW